MILLLENGRSMQIPASESVIGCCGDNEVETRKFLMPTSYNNIDIKDFSFILKIQPIDVKKLAYYDVLDKTITDGIIVLTWTIKRHNLVSAGKLKVQLCVLNEKGVELNSFTGTFLIEKSIPSSQEQGAIIPPTVFEQAVAKCTDAVGKTALDNQITTVNAKKAEEAAQKAEALISSHNKECVSKEELDLAFEGLGTSAEYNVGTNVDEIPLIGSDGKLPTSIIPSTTLPELGTSSKYNVGTNEGEIPILLENGKLPESVIPESATTEVYKVSSDSEMLNIPVQNGDICIKKENDKETTFIYTKDETQPPQLRMLRSNFNPLDGWTKISDNAQPDWNQKEESADDYIKNKPDLSQKQDVITYGVVTLETNWQENMDGGYIQETEALWLSSTDKVSLDVLLSDEMDVAKNQLEAWSNISRATVNDGSLTFYCFDLKPEVRIQVQVECKKNAQVNK